MGVRRRSAAPGPPLKNQVLGRAQFTSVSWRSLSGMPMRRVQLFLDGDAKPAVIALDQATGFAAGQLMLRRLLPVGEHRIRVKGVTVTGQPVSSPAITVRVKN